MLVGPSVELMYVMQSKHDTLLVVILPGSGLGFPLTSLLMNLRSDKMWLRSMYASPLPLIVEYNFPQ